MPAIGQQCADGNFYIGLSPADGERVYMTGAAHEGSGIRWDSASCSCCGDGSIATSQTDGRANTNALLAFNATGFDAAAHCESLNAIEAHSYDDWYLPAGGPDGSSSEINLIWEMVDDVEAVGKGHGDDPVFNLTLLEMLKQDFGIDMPDLAGELPSDGSGVNVKKVWDRVRVRIKDVPGFEVVPEVVLSTFSFAKYLMWEDFLTARRR